MSLPRRTVLRGAAALLAAPALSGCKAQSADLSKLTLPPLPGLRRNGIDVRGLEPGELRHGVTVLVSWAAECGACRQNHDYQLADTSRSYVMARIVSYGSPAASRKYLEEHGNPYDFVAYDAKGLLRRLTGYTAVPTTYVVDARGKVRYVIVGAIDPDRLEQFLLPNIQKAMTPSTA